MIPLLLLLITITSHGFYSLADMGYGDITLGDVQKNYTINYLLPENATQGPENWYVLRLNFTIEISGNGLVYLSADTNRYTCAQIKFEVQNKSIMWSWANLTEFKKGKAFSNVSIFFSNYLRYKGVKSGVNNLTIKLEKYGDVKIEKVVIYSNSSGIEYSNKSPAKLELYVFTPEKIKLGKKFKVKVSIKNVGDLSLKNVSILIKTSKNLRVLGEKIKKVEKLEEDTSKNVTFELEALREGECNILITAFARGSLTTPSALIKGKITNIPSLGLLVAITMIISVTLLIFIYKYKYIRQIK
ncbi:MAG: hypothetical protein DRN88_01455 [Candidatus Hydrothermarchaeota archaeon]|nr:MAG: hypothetical protein DRN88_01455 [Candidatus Hydrothermarchaeota archaeon]